MICHVNSNTKYVAFASRCLGQYTIWDSPTKTTSPCHFAFSNNEIPSLNSSFKSEWEQKNLQSKQHQFSSKVIYITFTTSIQTERLRYIYHIPMTTSIRKIAFLLNEKWHSFPSSSSSRNMKLRSSDVYFVKCVVIHYE